MLRKSKEKDKIIAAILDENYSKVRNLCIQFVISDPLSLDSYSGLLYLILKNGKLYKINKLIKISNILGIDTTIGNYIYFDTMVRLSILICKSLNITNFEEFNTVLNISKQNKVAAEIVSVRLAHFLKNYQLTDFSSRFLDQIFLFIEQNPNRDLIRSLVNRYAEADRGQEVLARLQTAGVSHNLTRKFLLEAPAFKNKQIPISLYFFPHDPPQLKRTIVVVGMKKSASLFAARVLGLTLDYPVVSGSVERAGNLDVDFIMQHTGQNVIIHTHTEPTRLAQQMLFDLGVVPLVVIRNIFDSIVSLKSRFDEIAHHLYPEYEMFSEELKYAYTFRKNFQAQFDFYVSWRRFLREDLAKDILVSTAAMNADPSVIFSKFLTTARVPYSKQALENAINFVNRSPFHSNINKIRGKKLPVDVGYELIPQYLVDYARNFYHDYPDIDFSLFDHRV